MIEDNDSPLNVDALNLDKRDNGTEYHAKEDAHEHDSSTKIARKRTREHVNNDPRPRKKKSRTDKEKLTKLEQLVKAFDRIFTPERRTYEGFMAALNINRTILARNVKSINYKKQMYIDLYSMHYNPEPVASFLYYQANTYTDMVAYSMDAHPLLLEYLKKKQDGESISFKSYAWRLPLGNDPRGEKHKIVHNKWATRTRHLHAFAKKYATELNLKRKYLKDAVNGRLSEPTGLEVQSCIIALYNYFNEFKTLTVNSYVNGQKKSHSLYDSAEEPLELFLEAWCPMSLHNDIRNTVTDSEAFNLFKNSKFQNNALYSDSNSSDCDSDVGLF